MIWHHLLLGGPQVVTQADLWVLGNLATDEVVLANGTTAMGLCGGNAIFAALGALALLPLDRPAAERRLEWLSDDGARRR